MEFGQTTEQDELTVAASFIVTEIDIRVHHKDFPLQCALAKRLFPEKDFPNDNTQILMVDKNTLKSSLVEKYGLTNNVGMTHADVL